MTIEHAATVMLLAATEKGVEVFMLERHLDSDFVGGAYVFPGGKVDDGDLELPQSLTVGSVCPALVDAVGSTMARGLAVAAIRETFEECGVLLGMVEGVPVTPERLTEASFVDARQRLAARNRPWDWTPWLEETGVALDLDALAWWSWWVTPEGIHRRFDTKFFAARLPVGHEPVHDDIETTDSLWTTARDALAAAGSGEVSIILPTRKNLEMLGGFSGVDEVWSAARDGRFERPRIQPEVTATPDGRILIDHPTFPAPEEI